MKHSGSFFGARPTASSDIFRSLPRCNTRRNPRLSILSRENLEKCRFYGSSRKAWRGVFSRLTHLLIEADFLFQIIVQRNNHSIKHDVFLPDHFIVVIVPEKPELEITELTYLFKVIRELVVLVQASAEYILDGSRSAV